MSQARPNDAARYSSTSLEPPQGKAAKPPTKSRAARRPKGCVQGQPRQSGRIFLGALLALAGCAQDVQPMDLELAETTEELHSNAEFDPTCRPTILGDLHESLQLGRTAAISAAFSQCLQSAFDHPITINGTGDVVGPYRPCANDPATPTAQKLLDKLSPDDRSIAVSCDEAAAFGGVAGIGTATGSREPMTLASVIHPFLACEHNASPSCVSSDAYTRAAAVIFHEALHTLGYDHMEFGTPPYTCGTGDPSLGYGHSVPYIVSFCMQSVLNASAANCAQTSCPNGGKAIVAGITSSGAALSNCVCVDIPRMTSDPDLLVFNSSTPPAVTYDWGTPEQDYLAGDFDGDGRTDVAQTYRRWSSIPVCLGNGSGWGCSNPAAAIHDDGVGQRFLTGDFDGDERSDVLSAASPASGLARYSVYRFDAGTRAWSSRDNPATVYNAGDPSQQLFTGDFDGDGKSDVFQAHPGWSSIPVCRSRGAATSFDCINPAATVYHTAGSQFLPADVNGDGRTDVIQVHPGWSSIPTCLSNGSGFNCSNPAATMYNTSPEQKFLTGDFDGDGRTDVFQVYRGWQSIPVCKARGAQWQCDNLPATIFDSGSAEQQFIAKDVNGDGRTDIIQAYRGWQSLPICYSTGTGWVCDKTPADIRNSGSAEQRFLVGDVDGNRRADIITAYRGWSMLPINKATHRVDIVLENVDDTGRVWIGDESGTKILEAASGPYPRAGSVNLNRATTNQGLVRVTVKLGNEGCFNSSGIVRILVDGKEDFQHVDAPATRICDAFYRQAFDIDIARGIVTAL